jgi:OOP family OmpA-OmpF porin
LGLSVDYLNYNRNREEMPGNTIDAGLFGSINMLNLLSPDRKGWKRGGLYANIGGGVGFFNAEVKSENLKVDGTSFFLMTGVGMEVPLGNTFALFGDVQYRRYALDGDDLGGHSSNKNDALYAALGLRVKFNANKREHMRNMTPVTAQDEIAALRRDLQQVEGRVNTMASNVNALDTRVNDNARQQAGVNRHLQDEIDALKKALRELDNQPVVMHNIEFKFDSSELTAASFTALDQIARELNANTAWNKLTISGHTDNIGTDAVNNRLSLARAETVKAYLVSRGVPAAKIETVGHGATRPIAPNNTAAGRQQNRRVEFQLSR